MVTNITTFTEEDFAPMIFNFGLEILVGAGLLATVLGIVLAINLIRGKGFGGKGGKKGLKDIFFPE